MIAFKLSNNLNFAWCCKTNTALVLYKFQAVHYRVHYEKFLEILISSSINPDEKLLKFVDAILISNFNIEIIDQEFIIKNDLFQIKSKTNMLLSLSFAGEKVKIPVMDSDFFFDHMDIFSEENIQQVSCELC